MFRHAKCLGLGNRDMSFWSTLPGSPFYYTGHVNEIYCASGKKVQSKENKEKAYLDRTASKKGGVGI